jgi:hypothetical protein
VAGQVAARPYEVLRVADDCMRNCCRVRGYLTLWPVLRILTPAFHSYEGRLNLLCFPLARYARDKEGRAIPWGVIEEHIKASHPYEVSRYLKASRHSHGAYISTEEGVHASFNRTVSFCIQYLFI